MMNLASLALGEEWLQCLDEVARAKGLELAPARLAAEVRALSDAYNTGAFARSRTKGALAARLMFSFPRDLPKMGAAARELVFTQQLGLPEARPLRVLDVGAGLGASTWGLARMLAASGRSGVIEATFVDDDEGALAVARAIASARAREGSIDVRVFTAGRGERSSTRFDAIVVGQSLGEIDSSEEGQAAFLTKLLGESLAPHGSLIVVEPALRDRTRRLHRVRDRLLAQADPPTVFAPCLHAQPCPALADESAWCHEDLPIDLPKRVASLARSAGLRWQGLTFSYLVLRKDGVTLRDASPPGSFRVVSLPIVTKGKREIFVCGRGERRRLSRLDRDSAKGDAWRAAKRGDVLSFEPALGSESRLSAQTTGRIEPG